MNDTKEIQLEADLCYNWGFGQYLSSFQNLVTALEKLGFKVKYQANKSSGGRQEVYLVNGSDKTLVYSKLETGKFLDETNSKDVAEKIKGMVSL